jgi:hypothetical protein
MRHRLAFVAAAVLIAVVVGPTAARAAAPVVSITFDDAVDGAEPVGTARDRVDDISWHALHTLPPLHATYYLNSSVIGTKYGFSLASLQQMDAAGDELGGHTVNHVDLAHLEDLDEVRREACGDRKALTLLPRSGGGTFDINAFAYPNGDYAWPDESPDDTHLTALIGGDATPGPEYGGCGYASARATGGVGLSTACVAATYTPACTLRNLPTLPLDPRLRYRIPTPASIDTANGSAHFTTLRNWVTAAERQGTATDTSTHPWLVLVFHHLCAPPSSDPNVLCAQRRTVRDDDFMSLIAYLKAEQAAGRLAVRDVTEALDAADGTLTRERPLPAAAIPPVTARATLTNGTMDADTPIGLGPADGRPDCFSISADDEAVTHRQLHQADGTVGWVAQLDVPRGGEQRFTVRPDLGGCAVRTVAGGRYKITLQYRLVSPGADLAPPSVTTTAAGDGPLALFAFSRSTGSPGNGPNQYIGKYLQPIGAMPWPVRTGWRTASCVTRDTAAGREALAPGIQIHNTDDAPGIAGLRDPATGMLSLLVDNVTMTRTSTAAATCS